MIEFVQAPCLSSVKNIRHGFFTRLGGVSSEPFATLNCSEASFDAPEKVEENRRRIAEAMGGGLDDLMICKQVHSTEVEVLSNRFPAGLRPQADAMVTDRRGIILGILTADCAPILLVDEEAGVIGAAHAGWRGALDGIIDQTVTAMEHLGAEAPRMVAAIGPCIWQDSYEVGVDFPIPFYIEDDGNTCFFKPSPKRGHSLFDLPGFIESQLRKAGVGQIEKSPADTFQDEARFFSHRRGYVRGQKEEGRMLSCIVME